MSLYPRIGKRALDLCVSIVLLLITAPLQGLIALGIRVTSGSPVLFKQQRAGQNGAEFTILKFRTMVQDAHQQSNGYPDHRHITGLGKVLRKTSLDELPQLMNIVRGDMAIVGPRPALMDQVNRYTARQKGRLSVRPGVTGLAQVRYRNAASWTTRIDSDLEYVNAISLLGDIRLILRTVPAVLFGTGVIAGQTQEEVDDLQHIEDPQQNE